MYTNIIIPTRVVSSDRVDNLDYRAITTVSKKLKKSSTSSSSSSSSSSSDDDNQISQKVSKTLESSSKKQEYVDPHTGKFWRGKTMVN